MDNVIVSGGAHNWSLGDGIGRCVESVLNPINSYEEGRISDLKNFERVTFQSTTNSSHLSNADSR